jgi:hypothetical protein
MICPHVITEHAEDAVPYCQICAPKEIIQLKKEYADLHKLYVEEVGKLYELLASIKIRHPNLVPDEIIRIIS